MKYPTLRDDRAAFAEDEAVAKLLLAALAAIVAVMIWLVLRARRSSGRTA